MQCRSKLSNYTPPGPINTTNLLNPKINSNLNTEDKWTYLVNSSLENLEEKLILSVASTMDTDSDLDVSVKLDSSVPHVPRTIVDSVTAVFAV